MKRLVGIGLCVVVASALGGCKQDAKALWTNVLQNCAVSDFNSPNVLYFGTSNTIGAGSILRLEDDKAYHLRYDLTADPKIVTFVTRGVPSACNGTSSGNFTLQFGVNGNTPAGAASIAGQLQNATNVSVNATSASWDTLQEGPYDSYINSLPPDNPLRHNELDSGDDLVVFRALRISGFSATLTFNQNDYLNLKKDPAAVQKTLSDSIGGSVNISFTSDDKLVITTAGDFYIGGELASYKPAGPRALRAAPWPPVALESDALVLSK